MNRKQQYKYRWDDRTAQTGPITRERVAQILFAARSRRDTIHRINGPNRPGYTVGTLNIRPTR